MSWAGDFEEHAAAGRRGLRLEPVRGAKSLMRLSLSVLGAGLTFAIALLWIAPGAIWDAELFLMKAVLSVALATTAWVLFRSGRSISSAAEVEVDLVRREVRVVRRTPQGRTTERTCAFAQLDRAEACDGIIGLWDAGGQHLADVALRDRDAARLLKSALRDAGKL